MPRLMSRLGSAVLAAVGVLALMIGSALPAGAACRPGHQLIRAHRQVVAYYQTIYTTAADGTKTYVDPRPLAGAATDVEVGAIHLDAGAVLHVNDVPADDPSLARAWRDLHGMQRHGVRVEAFLGGAAQGSYRNLATDFGTYYPLLRHFLQTYRLDGIDLDIEESFGLADTVKLITALRHDFGPRFVITLAPVATDLSGGSNFSGGFSYPALEKRAGSMINWYNTQFYCGWGDLVTTEDYDAVLAAGFAPSRIVAGTVTNPEICSGYVDPSRRKAVLHRLVRQHRDFGGVAGFEYFDALGPVTSRPASWYAAVRQEMR